jgi:hypothetical protein
MIIHIGTHKTGTTSIQCALQNILQPAVKELWCARKVVRLPKFTNGVTCFEGYSGDHTIGYLNADVIAESLRLATSHLPTTIVVYLRRQDDFIQSMYSQMLKQGASYTFKEYIAQFDGRHFNWDYLVRCYKDRFENVIVRPYCSDVVADFCNLIVPDKYARRNKRYCNTAMEKARLANPRLTEAGRRRLRVKLERLRGTQKDLFESVEAKEAFMERYNGQLLRV